MKIDLSSEQIVDRINNLLTGHIVLDNVVLDPQIVLSICWLIADLGQVNSLIVRISYVKIILFHVLDRVIFYCHNIDPLFTFSCSPFFPNVKRFAQLFEKIFQRRGLGGNCWYC